MARTFSISDRGNILITALAPLIWGSSYVVLTEFLPGGNPFWLAMLRALPAGLLLLLVVRQLPKGIWWQRVFILGALNFTVFWSLLYVAAYRLPGGVAATLGATQPLLVVFLARAFLGATIRPLAIVAALMGLGGVAMLVLGPNAQWDATGVLAASASAVSMAFGTVLTRRWQPEVSSLTFTAWQLAAGGILLLPVALVMSPELPTFDGKGLLGLAYLAIIGAAITYALWFRGVAKLAPARVSSLSFLSPLSAVLLGWLILGEGLSSEELTGVLLTLLSVWLSQNAARIRIFPRSRLSKKGA
ncbi:MAG: EamA family transporter [Alphaproteobacteria bacterium]|nr:EamA family transporter [Alphaproteobacteria bacterium]